MKPPMTKAAQLALGRILRLASRAARPGDSADYEAARRVFLQEAQEAGIFPEGSGPSVVLPPHGWNRGVIE